MRRNLKAEIVRHYGQQDDFARVLGVADSMVSMVVTGRYNLKQNEQRAWAKKLQYDGNLEELFRDVE